MAEDKIELNPDPTSTYGASEAYKAAWNAQYGEKAPTDPTAGETPVTNPIVTDKNASNQSGGSIPTDPK